MAAASSVMTCTEVPTPAPTEPVATAAPSVEFQLGAGLRALVCASTSQVEVVQVAHHGERSGCVKYLEKEVYGQGGEGQGVGGKMEAGT